MLDEKRFDSPLIEAQTYLMKGEYLTSRYRYDEAIELLIQSESIVKKNKLKANATQQFNKIVLASCYANSGRYYLGMDCYQQLIQSSNTAKVLKDAAVWCLSYIRIAMGQYETIKQQIENSPRDSRPVFELCLEQKNGETKLLENLIMNGFPEGFSEKHFDTVLHERMILSLFVLAEEELIIQYKNSSVRQQYSKKNILHSWTRKLVLMNSLLLEISSNAEPKSIPHSEMIRLDIEEEWTPYYKLWFYHKKLITLKYLNLMQYAEDILENINDLYLKYSFNDPIFPNLHNDEWYPKSNWSEALSAFLGIGIGSKVRTEQLIIQSKYVIFHSESKTIDVNFSKKHLSLRALKIISGPVGNKLSKKYLHEQLTACKYSSHLHDNRLHQLFRRIKRDLEQSGVSEPWSFTKDGYLELYICIINKD